MSLRCGVGLGEYIFAKQEMAGVRVVGGSAVEGAGYGGVVGKIEVKSISMSIKTMYYSTDICTWICTIGLASAEQIRQ